jgi:WD40 repeat protein
MNIVRLQLSILFIAIASLGCFLASVSLSFQSASETKPAASPLPGEVRQFPVGEYGAHTLAFSPDGRLIVAAGHDGVARLLVVACGKEIQRLMSNELGFYQIKQVGFSSDGQRAFATGNFDLLFRCWDRKTGRQLTNLKEPGEAFLDAIERAVLPKSLVTNEKVEYARAEMAEGLMMIHATFRQLQRAMLAVSGDGRRGVSLTALRRSLNEQTVNKIVVRVWNLNSGKELHRFEGKVAPDWAAFLERLHANWDWLLSLVAYIESCSDSTLIDFIGSSNDASLDCLAVCDWKLSPDGRKILCGCNDGHLRLWDLETGRLLHRFPRESYRINAVALSPCGQLALVATGVGSGEYPPSNYVMHLWDVERGKLIHTLVGHEKSINCAAFSPDGRRILSGGEDRTVRLWDVASGREIHCFRGHTSDITGVVFSPDGKNALSSGDWNNNTHDPIRLWRLPE